MGFAGLASAQTCSTTQYPYPLTNGQVADATQVTADLTCAPVYGLANWSGNVGIGTKTPTEKFWVQDGEIWASGNSRLAFSTDESTDTTPNVAFGASGNDAYIANWSGAGYNQNVTVLGVNGYVGIGTTAPTEKLWVQDGEIWASGNSRLAFSTDESTDATPNVAFGASGNDAYIANWSGSGYNRNVTVLGVNGDVGIGTTSPTATLYVNGSTVLSQGYTQASDARLKRDVRPLTGALALVAKMQGVRYNWKPVAERTVGKDLNLPLDEPQVGFLAQDLEKVLPEAVKAPKPGTSDTYSVEETKVVPVLVEAIKEQQAEIRELREEIAKLRTTKQ